MLFPFAGPARAREGGEQRLVHARVERRELAPFLEIAEGFVAGRAAGEALQKRGMDRTEATPLSSQPAVEQRRAVHLQAFEEVAAKQRGEILKGFERQLVDAL